MGYDLHITRRKLWTDAGKDITAAEWLAYVERDKELRHVPENGPYFVAWTAGAEDSWLDWSDGQISSKYPDATLIDKMVSIARQLDACVRGDEGEIYSSGQSTPQPMRISLGQRVANWFTRFRLRLTTDHVSETVPLPFDVGDTVRDPWGKEHTVLSIDPKAEHGMGVIRTRRSSDGTEHKTAMIAHGFHRVGS